jgi:uncharacterized protein (DUF4213/DUF364 family)
MWEIYDRLIEAVPSSSVVDACVCGLHWFLVRSEGVGAAMTPREGEASVAGAGSLAGMKTRALAARVKSWNWHEAALGLAAINSALNAPAVVDRIAGLHPEQQPSQDVFSYLLDEFRGKKVAVIGHFRNLDQVAAVCDLTILERRPQNGDLPDPACEWVLPQQDIVVITATTLINKTLPRLLELSRGARVVLAGPSTPLTPLLFHYGIEVLGGLVIDRQDDVWKAVQEGGQREIFEHGSRMARLVSPRVPCPAR